MTIEIKPGTLSDFFVSAKEKAKEIDEGRRLTPKNIIWVAPSDLLAILKPERTKLIRYLRGNKVVAGIWGGPPFTWVWGQEQQPGCRT